MSEKELTTEFLEKYKELEEYENIYPQIFNKFKNNNKNLFKSAKGVRNVLSHKTSNGEYPIFVNEFFLRELENVLYKMNLRVIDCAVLFGSMFVANMDDKLSYVLKNMSYNNYSYVPIVDDKVVKGVLTENSILDYIVNNGTGIIYDEKTTIKELKDFIALDCNRSESFAFVPKDTFMVEVEEKFRKVFKNNKRLAVIYITETGKKEEKILGMVTAFDILGKN